MGLAAIPFLPSSFTERADTIKNYKADESASTRLAVWAWTWEYVKEHPMGGGFEVYRQNRIRYDMAQKDNPDQPAAGRCPRGQGNRGSRSRLPFELFRNAGRTGLSRPDNVADHPARRGLADGGHPAACIASETAPTKTWVAPLATALQNSQIIYLVGSLFVGIAFQAYFFMLTALQIGLDTYLARRRQEAAWRADQKPADAAGRAIRLI